MMPPAQIQYIYQRCLAGTATNAEQQQLIDWLLLPENEVPARQLLQQAYHDPKETVDLDEGTAVSIVQAILHAGDDHADQVPGVQESTGASAPVRRLPFFQRRSWWAAAILILAVTTAWLLVLPPQKNNKIPVINTASEQPDIVPGGNKAMLTLGDGTTIVLDSVANGLIRLENGTTINKVQNGALTYRSANGTHSPATAYNMLTTPRGGQYQVTLPDGSKVWLNAASSIRYPTAFVGNERKVIITGEAYFEIAKDRTKPFRVATGAMTVEVLGTHFNVNAYTDENTINTTLLEGSVLVKNGAVPGVSLKPGQQARVTNVTPTDPIIVQPTDTEAVIAWKNGLFRFNNADVHMLMRQIARWYDVQIQYEGTIPARGFEGKIQRELNLSDVLEVLKKAGLRCRMEGRTLIVMP